MLDGNGASGNGQERELRKPDLKKPPVLFDKTQDLIEKIEKQIDCKIICYWNSTRGSVCDNDAVALYEILKNAKGYEKTAIFVKSGGGDVEASLKVVHLLRDYVDDLIALIPLECASAATIIALGANRLVMGPLSYLTAIDSALRHKLSPIDEIYNSRVSVSLDELHRIVTLWNKHARAEEGNPLTDIFQHIHPLVIGAIERASSLSAKICQEVLSYHIKDTELCHAISNRLNSDYPSHTYPITSREAKQIGLNVEPLPDPVNELLLALNVIYSEMAQPAITDFNEHNYHDNTILSIIERHGMQIFYQVDEDRTYLKEERRWMSLNSEDSWRMIKTINGEQHQSELHIR